MCEYVQPNIRERKRERERERQRERERELELLKPGEKKKSGPQ